uniref:(northern house mosquito) hypothetical protein n=1 Tax=Culex pipiens TaxID=7175 RepID=A0A8D7ZWA1_CULPI
MISSRTVSCCSRNALKYILKVSSRFLAPRSTKSLLTPFLSRKVFANTPTGSDNDSSAGAVKFNVHSLSQKLTSFSFRILRFSLRTGSEKIRSSPANSSCLSFGKPLQIVAKLSAPRRLTESFTQIRKLSSKPHPQMACRCFQVISPKYMLNSSHRRLGNWAKNPRS